MRTDEELVAQWRAGSHEAANALSERYYERVFRFFEVRLQRSAEDLTQRTFLLCAEQLDRITDAFRPYLFGIARRQLTRALRDHYTDANRIRRFGEPVAGVHQTRLSALAARRQEQQLLLRALAALPPDTQMTLVLFYWENMNAAHLSGVFEISHSAMRSRIAKARSDLRETIDKIATTPALREAVKADIEGWARSLASPPNRAAGDA